MKNILFLFSVLFASCSAKLSDPNEIIEKSVEAYGFNDLDGVVIQFDFRDKSYGLKRSASNYLYSRAFQDSSGYIIDSLKNSTEFKRTQNGEVIALEEEWKEKYSNSVNSVLYFFQLPLTLNDPAAIKTLKEVVSFMGNTYYVIEVAFEKENGGKDFEDVFLYWINVENFFIDYFAYSYITDGGGIRFREAIERKRIEEFIFQDYINYKPPSDKFPLGSMLTLFESGKLEELSRIENKNIVIRR
jgi:hypothetical protein